MFVLVLTSFHSVDTPEAQWPNECVLHGKKAASAKIWLTLLQYISYRSSALLYVLLTLEL